MLFTFLVPILFLFSLLLSNQTQTIPGFGNFLLGVFGCLGAFLGLILWGWGFISLGSSFSVLPKAKKLKTKGAYQFFRHPIYLGIDLSCLGIAIGLGSWPGLLFTLFVIVPLNFFRAKREEKKLEKQFREEYLLYKSKYYN